MANRAKIVEKEEARKLRLEGKPINEIARLLQVSKGSVHLWTMGIPIPEQFTLEFIGRDKRKRRQEIEANKVEALSRVVILDKEPYVGWQMYKPYVMKKQGRSYVGLRKDGIWKMRTLARFNMEINLGRELKYEEQVDHIDEDKTNDNIENLQILPALENSRKARAHGKGASTLSAPRGENNGLSKFTNIEVENLRKEFLQGNYSIKSFAKKHKVAYPSMSSILRGLTYSNVPMPEGLKEFTDNTAKKFGKKHDSVTYLKIKELLMKGHSSYKIAKILSMPTSTVHYLVKKHNLTPSSNSQEN